MLLYVGTAIAFAAGLAGTLLVALAWVYVGLRLLHSFIHLGSNDVLWRFRVFALSWIALLAYWVVLALELVKRPAGFPAG